MLATALLKEVRASTSVGGGGRGRWNLSGKTGSASGTKELKGRRRGTRKPAAALHQRWPDTERVVETGRDCISKGKQTRKGSITRQSRTTVASSNNRRPRDSSGAPFFRPHQALANSRYETIRCRRSSHRQHRKHARMSFSESVIVTGDCSAGIASIASGSR